MGGRPLLPPAPRSAERDPGTMRRWAAPPPWRYRSRSRLQQIILDMIIDSSINAVKPRQ
jgi:hypothetical protein